MLKDGYEDVRDLINVFGRHCDTLSSQCSIESEKKYSCKIQTNVCNSKLLHIRALCIKLSSDLRYMNIYKYKNADDCVRYIDKSVLQIEKLQITFAQVQGIEQAQALKRSKVLAFCDQINMSLAEAHFLFKYQQLSKSNSIPKLAQRLLKSKKKIIRIFQMKTNWEKPYLRQVKRYKITAQLISDSINFLNRRDYE